MTTDSVVIVLAGAPMGKERVRMTRAGHAFTPHRTVNYEGRLALAAQTVMDGRPLLDGPLVVEVEAHMPIAVSKPAKWKAAALAGEIRPVKKPDLDNIAKIAGDALNLVVWVDDSQIVRFVLEKHYSDNPRLVMKVRPHRGGVFE